MTITKKNDNAAESEKLHSLFLEGREKLIIHGVNEVCTFDENEIVLNTSLGRLNIKGKRLEITSVSTDSGELCAMGDIRSLTYSEKRRFVPDNAVSRLFR